jgi:hemolysin-activating ACP:hemolysin acyltransferase
MFDENQHRDFFYMCDVAMQASRETSINEKTFSFIRKSVLTNNYHIFFGDTGLPAGYLIWARTGRETILGFQRTDELFTSLEQWNEGGIFFILDIRFASRSIGKHNLVDLKQLLRKERIFAYTKNNILTLLKKRGRFRKRIHPLTLLRIKEEA